MALASLVFGAYVTVGVVWFLAMLGLSQSSPESVSLREALFHILAWPYVFAVLRLWWALIVAAAMIGILGFVVGADSSAVLAGTIAAATQEGRSKTIWLEVRLV
jgi:hypothetical protein